MFHQRRFRGVVLVALVGVGAWFGLRAGGWERPVFRLVAGCFVNPPLFVTGDGTRGSPWRLRAETPVTHLDPAQAPVVVSLGDDPQGVFQTSPPSPLDVAFVLDKLQRLGARKAAVAAVLAWDNPDAAAYESLKLVLRQFELLVQASPLTRGTGCQPMPPAFRRASIPVAEIGGNLTKLPIINRLAVADAVFAGDKALAGFSTLDDADSGGDRVPMLARWEEEDRVVLAFPLLAVLARHDLPVGGVKVRVGESIQLGPKGPMIPVDEFGCLALQPEPIPARVDVAAEELSLANSGIFPRKPGLIVLRDDQSGAAAATKRFSGQLAAVMAMISSDAGLGRTTVYPRLAPAWEAAAGGLFLLGWLWATGRTGYGRVVAFGGLLAGCLAAQWLGVGMWGVWLPGVPLALGLLVGTALFVLPGAPQLAAVVTPPLPAGTNPLPPRALPAANLRTVTVWRDSASAMPGPLPAPVEPPAAPPPIVDPPATGELAEPDAEPPKRNARTTKSAKPRGKAATGRTSPTKAAGEDAAAAKSVRRRKSPPAES